MTSNEVVGYNRSEMPNRGIDWALGFQAVMSGLLEAQLKRNTFISSPFSISLSVTI